MKPDVDDEHLPLSKTPPVDEDVRREIDFHLHERARELELRGIPHERALALARDSFGDSAAIEAECRTIERRRRSSARRAGKLEALIQDARVGMRVLRRTPGFTIAAILTLALGIGANAAVFSIVNRIILQPLPYEDSQQLMTIVERHPNNAWSNMPWANFLDVQAQSQSFVAISSYGSGTSTVLTGSVPVRVRTSSFSFGLFDVLPVRPELGRLPTADEHRESAPPVALVSHAFWRDVLGAPASLDSVRVKLALDYAVVGVLPATFGFPQGTQVWTPMELQTQSMSRTSHNWSVLGRLKPGVTRIAAQRELDALLARLKPVHHPDFDAVGARLTSLQESLTGTLQTPLYLLLAASALLLLTACSNLAGGMLARGTTRTSEFALRSAIGATRVRLVRQLLTESALIALFGGVGGVVLASVLLRVVGPLAPATLRMDLVRIDWWVYGFAFSVAIATTVLFGLFPALRLSDTQTALALREAGGGGTAGARRMRAWDVLLGAEIALAVVLFVSSAILVKSFARVMDTDLGFDPRGVLALSVNLPAINYEAASPRVAAFHEQVLERVRGLPGVQSVGFANVLPLQGSNPNGGIWVEGKPFLPRGGATGYAIYRVVGGDYFDALGIKINRGRTFRPDDAAPDAFSVLVNESFASTEWPDIDPIGKRVRVAGMDGREEPWYTVIGVVADTRASSVTGAFSPTYFFDHRKRPPYRTRSVSYVVRSTLGTPAVLGAFRREISAVDPQVPMELTSMSDVVLRTVADRRFTMIVLGSFASVALALAIVGIYGVVSYAVAQRTREIGVRRALGATNGQVRGLILRGSLVWLGPGLAVGVLLSFASSRALRNLVYGVSPFDASAVVTAVVVLGAAAIVACVIPAFRATRVDPTIAMRGD